MKIRIRKGLNNILISLGVISLLGNSRKVMGQTFYQCMPCKAGYYSDGSGGGCKVCPRGTYSAHSISEKCTTCPEGQYTDSEGSTSCKACPKGSYCTGGHKYECNDGYYQDEEGKRECKRITDRAYMCYGYANDHNCFYFYAQHCNKSYICNIDMCKKIRGGCPDADSSGYCAHDYHVDKWNRKDYIDSVAVGRGGRFYINCSKVKNSLWW